MIVVKQIKYTRLDKLKEEKKIIEGLKCLSFDCKDACLEWYEHEIEAINLGSANPTYEEMVSEYK